MSLACYATIHLARFDEVVSIDSNQSVPMVGDPSAWMVGTDNAVAGTAPGLNQGAAWIALGLHADRSSAHSVFDAGGDAVPYFAGAVESWSAVLEPIGHRGEVNWLDNDQPGLVFSVTPRRTVGSFVVVTSVGWTFDERFDLNKAMDFAHGVERVRSTMDGVDGLGSQQAFSFPSLASDGITVTFWRDDASMRAFAYRPGEHKFQIDRYRELVTADRSSFTRFVPIVQRGTWNGRNPLAL